MSRFLLLVLPALILGTSAIAGGARDARPRSQQPGVSSDDVIPGVVVVKLKHSNSMAKSPAVHRDASSLLQAFAQCGVTSLAPAFPMTAPLSDAAVASGRIDLSQICFAAIPSGMNPSEVAARIAALPEVEYAEPKYKYRMCDVPDDSDYAPMQQVYFDRMHVAEGWTLQKGRAEVVIATVDGGTNWQHEDLTANLWVNPSEDINHNGHFDPGPPPQGDEDGIDQDGNGKVDDVIGWNFANKSNNPRGSLLTPGSSDHGTETASEFGAVTNNGRGMAGTSWNCRLMPVCAADPSVDFSILHGFEGIEYASRMGARVINCSWYRAGGWGNFSQWEQDVITAATQRGALVVAAAGNNHLQNLDVSLYYPATYDHVLSVGATTDTSDEIAYFTNIGLNVSVFAPGMRIHVAKDNGSYGTDQGTSHSSPLVAGLAGLLFAAHPDWSPDQVAEQIRMAADPIDGSNSTQAGSLGHGRVNFFRALAEVHSGVVVVAGRFHTPSERTIFVQGDTVILSVKVKNVLTIAAENLSFNVTVDPVLAPFAPIRGPTRLDPGAEDSLTCAFRVGDVIYIQDVTVRLEWSANSDERDGHMFKTTLYGWSKRPGNPVFTSDAMGSWYNAVWSPSILYNPDSSRYEMWFSTGPGSELNWQPFQIAFAVSRDGLSWTLGSPTPILTSIPGTWEYNVANPSVLREIGGYKMWYSGLESFNGTDSAFIGFATSPDGIHWTRYAGNPVLRPGPAAWEYNGIGDVSVMKIGSGYTMWYDGSPMSNIEIGRIGRATSTDGIHWTKDDLQNPILDMGTAGQWDQGGLAFPRVFVVRDTFFMCYTCIKSNGDWRAIGLARSTDGGTVWQKIGTGPILASTAHSWDESFVQEGFVLPMGNELYMWYSGCSLGANKVSIGIATSPNPITGIAELRHGVPSMYALEQNYPNPFNPSTTIRYGLPVRAQVVLTVFNILGQLVATLVQGEEDAGYHEVRFEATGLSSGVYFYQLKAGEFVQTKKLLLIH